MRSLNIINPSSEKSKIQSPKNLNSCSEYAKWPLEYHIKMKMWSCSMHRFQGRLKVLFSRSDAVEMQFKHHWKTHLSTYFWSVGQSNGHPNCPSVPSFHCDGASVSVGDLHFWPLPLLCNSYASVLPDFSPKSTWLGKGWLQKTNCDSSCHSKRDFKDYTFTILLDCF